MGAGQGKYVCNYASNTRTYIGKVIFIRLALGNSLGNLLLYRKTIVK